MRSASLGACHIRCCSSRQSCTVTSLRPLVYADTCSSERRHRCQLLAPLAMAIQTDNATQRWAHKTSHTRQFSPLTCQV